MLAEALARSDLRYLFVQGGVVLHGERNSMSPGFEFSLGDANLALIVASLFSLDARFLDHAAPLLVVRLELLERLRGGQDLGVAAGGVDLVEQVLVRARLGQRLSPPPDNLLRQAVGAEHPVPGG